MGGSLPPSLVSKIIRPLQLAELQLRILWEELLKRFDNIEVVGEPERVQSNFVRGYSRLMVKLTAKSQ